MNHPRMPIVVNRYLVQSLNRMACTINLHSVAYFEELQPEEQQEYLAAVNKLYRMLGAVLQGYPGVIPPENSLDQDTNPDLGSGSEVVSENNATTDEQVKQHQS